VNVTELCTKIIKKYSKTYTSPSLNDRPSLTWDQEKPYNDFIQVEAPSLSSIKSIPIDISLMYKHNPNVSSLDRENKRLQKLAIEQRKRKMEKIKQRQEQQDASNSEIEQEEIEEEEEEEEYSVSEEESEMEEGEESENAENHRLEEIEEDSFYMSANPVNLERLNSEDVRN
jgi:hypothetical protein